MTNMFSEETVDITVTDSTKIVKMTYENQERKETTLTAADLHEGDILSVDLEDGSQIAIMITLSEGGGFGGMGGGMGRAGKNERQSATP